VAPVRTPLGLDALELGYFAETFEGFGYLGERGRELWTAAGRERVALVDAAILARANELGWTAEQLFGWTNSRNGRHFADAVFGFRFGPETLGRAMAELGPGGSARLGPVQVR
jgi:hypothetical protein